MKVRQKDSSYSDAHKITFNVVKTSAAPLPSHLYSDCLPILMDRKVPAAKVEQVARESATATGDAFHDAFEDSAALAEWIVKQRRVAESRTCNAVIDTVCGFPAAPEEQVLRMLTAGFDPTNCRHVASTTKIILKQYLDEVRSSFKMPLRNSTMLFGIADPKKVLRPGEIHVGFSRPFKDAQQSRTNLRGLQALVFRSPSLGAPDIPRVRCVYKEQLSHLNDVVVFPSVGPRSLASKLQ